MSTLESLFRYARSERAHARENFTTEALASCLRVESAPFIKALSGAIPPLVASERITIDRVITQMPIPGVGALDMVVHGTDSSRPIELWGELKVEASESGDQIRRYEAHRASLPAPQPELFTLGRSPLRGHGDVPHLTWHKVARAAQAAASPHWRDFVEYLRENGLTDNYDEPLEIDEGAALSRFDGLVGKIERILTTAFEVADRDATGGFNWPRGSIRKELVTRFTSKGNLLVGIEASRPRTSWVVLGAVPDGIAVNLAVWVETWPSQTDLQRTIRARATDGSLDATKWAQKHGSWGGLQAIAHWTPGMTTETAAEWFLDRIRDLERAGVLGEMQASEPLDRTDPAEQMDVADAAVASPDVAGG